MASTDQSRWQRYDQERIAILGSSAAPDQANDRLLGPYAGDVRLALTEITAALYDCRELDARDFGTLKAQAQRLALLFGDLQNERAFSFAEGAQ